MDFDIKLQHVKNHCNSQHMLKFAANARIHGYRDFVILI